MKKAGLFLLILILWCTLSLSLILGTLLVGPVFKNQLSINLLVGGSSQNIFEPEEGFANLNKKSGVLAIIKGGDSRAVLVDRFLATYASPMQGMGKQFVTAADQNGLDWRLLPAIAFQESNLGKKIPRNSHNPFGWAIYEGKNSGAYFDSWSEAINIVATRMRENYSSDGLINPESIVFRYTSQYNPTWVFAVRSAMEEISTTEY
jgi:hypothetical protein